MIRLRCWAPFVGLSLWLACLTPGCTAPTEPGPKGSDQLEALENPGIDVHGGMGGGGGGR